MSQIQTTKNRLSSQLSSSRLATGNGERGKVLSVSINLEEIQIILRAKGLDLEKTIFQRHDERYSSPS